MNGATFRRGFRRGEEDGRLGEELEEAWTLGPDEFAMLAGKLVAATTLVLVDLRPNSIL